MEDQFVAGDLSCAVQMSPAGPATGGSLKLGASFTGVTVMLKVFVLRSMPPSAVPPLSCTSTDTVAEPKALVAGVKVSVPPTSIVGWTLNSAVLLLTTLNPRIVSLPSFAGPTLKIAWPLRVAAPLSSNTTILFDMKVTPGALFTGVTVIRKVCGTLRFVPPLAVPPLSWATMVTVAVP